MQTLFVSERAGQNTVEYAVALADPTKRYTLARYRTDDVYANPGAIVMVRGGGGRRARRRRRRRTRRLLRPRRRHRPALGRQGERVLPGQRLRQEPAGVGPKSFIDKVAIKTGDKQRIYESENANVYERVASILDIDAGKFIVSRESPTDVPQNYLLDGGQAHPADAEQGLHAGPDPRREGAVHGRAPRRVQVQGEGDAAVRLQGGHAAAGALLVLPARVRDARGLRPARPDVQQERVRELRHAIDGVLRPPGLRGHRTRRADRRPAGTDEQQLRERSAERSRGDDR